MVKKNIILQLNYLLKIVNGEISKHSLSLYNQFDRIYK